MSPETSNMSIEKANLLPKSEGFSLNFTETELTLGLPGIQRGSTTQTEVTGKTTAKRGFSDTVDLNLKGSAVDSSAEENGDQSPDLAKDQVSGAGKLPASKQQVVGWPPVRSFRKNSLKSCSYVKVAVDGAPYLRKVDLEIYGSYQQLLSALEEMFSCFTIRHCLNKSKLMDRVNGTEYVPTYEDKDGDWMLVGDVPWKMFVESCKRMRLMKSSEAVGLAPRRMENCSNTSS